jgi:hypothetical protein
LADNVVSFSSKSQVNVDGGDNVDNTFEELGAKLAQLQQTGQFASKHFVTRLHALLWSADKAKKRAIVIPLSFLWRLHQLSVIRLE